MPTRYRLVPCSASFTSSAHACRENPRPSSSLFDTCQITELSYAKDRIRPHRGLVCAAAPAPGRAPSRTWKSAGRVSGGSSGSPRARSAAARRAPNGRRAGAGRAAKGCHWSAAARRRGAAGRAAARGRLQAAARCCCAPAGAGRCITAAIVALVDLGLLELLLVAVRRCTMPSRKWVRRLAAARQGAAIEQSGMHAEVSVADQVELRAGRAHAAGERRL